MQPIMKKTAALILCLAFPLLTFASPDHTDDHLVVDGKSYYIRANPLDKFLSHSCKQAWLKTYVNDFCEPYWPNYTRYWKIEDNQLFLIKIETNGPEKKQYPLEKLFTHYEGKPMFAKWFTGILSHQYKESPVIHLNHDYYEEEAVIRIAKGVVIEQFKTNHRDRWISYARRLMQKDCPLADVDLNALDESVNRPGGMNDFLDDAFSIINHPEEKPSKYYPVIRVHLNANLDRFRPKEAHKQLDCYELLEAIAKETQTQLKVFLDGTMVIYEINNPEPHPKTPPPSTEN
jgi:hypothetical protein